MLNEVGLQIGESGKNIGAQLAGIIQEDVHRGVGAGEWRRDQLGLSRVSGVRAA